MHGVVLQTDGLTPLHMTSVYGHVECVLALVDRGAAINQATVGCTTWTAEYCGGGVCAGMCGRHRACMVSLWGALGWKRLSAWASSGGVYMVHVGVGQHPDHRLLQSRG